ncbi:MAG: T9SS type A sorting domain-containing protein [Dysgonamonadaceae bacterium]|jgi:predicted outer membrane repeat protein|nr:T9SS type A sorting domain-containing protein [Dysgonamonadaceae bacterium]
MKTNLLKKISLIVSITISTVVTAPALDVYLASGGSDDNDGLTAGTAVATLQKAYNLIPANNKGGHVIHVSGFIDIPEEVNMQNLNQTVPGANDGSKFLTLDGGDSTTSGFDGGDATRLINMQGNAGAITFKNLTFRHARGEGSIRIVNAGTNVDTQLKKFEQCRFSHNTSTANSSILHCYRGGVVVDDCEFDNNSGVNRSGAVWVGTDAIVTIRNSRIHDNIATGSGGAIYVDGNGKLTLQSTAIWNHDLSGSNNTDGGAIFCANPNGISIDGCIIRNNKVKRSGGAIYINPSNNADSTVVIKNTLIANNEAAGNSGGGVYIANETAGSRIDVSFINSTIYGNKTTHHGGGVFATGAQPGSSLRFINCTVTDNESTNNNGGFGAGVSIRGADQNIRTYIYNSIVESNFASVGETTKIYSDFWFSGGTITPQGLLETNCFLHHSIVGTHFGNLQGSIPADNRINSGVNGAGLAVPHADYIASQNSIPLDFDSEALQFGDAQYLQALDIHTDQNGNIRSFADGKCAAGAVEVPAEFVVTHPDPHDYQHFIIYGQSLSVGYQAYQSLSLDNVPGNYMIGDQVWLNYGNTVFDQLNPLTATSALTSAAIAECPVTAAVNHIRLRQETDFPERDNRFIATSTGMGGKTIEQLSKGHAERHYNVYESALKSAYGIAARSGSTITCPAIFWMQGEYNYTSAVETPTPKDDYKAALVQLKNDMQADAQEKYGQSGAPLFITYQVGAQYTRGRLEAGMAQLEASNEYEDIICAGPVYPVTDVGGHIDANGSRWYGEMLGKAYYQTKVLGQKFKPLQPLRITLDNNDDKQVIIHYYVPVKPVVLDTLTLRQVSDYGFEVYSNEVRQPISRVEVTGDDEVTITCAAPLSGEVTVAYAGVNVNTRGHGNLRDSDPAKAFGRYIDPELKTDGENYDYPHYPDPNQVTFIPSSGEPLDPETLLPIYGQAYPLYNFSVAFYLPAEKPTALPSANVRRTDVYVAKDILHVNGKATVSLLDLSGQTVGSFHSEGRYDLAYLPSGVYIVRVQTKEEVKSLKIIL